TPKLFRMLWAGSLEVAEAADACLFILSITFRRLFAAKTPAEYLPRDGPLMEHADRFKYPAQKVRCGSRKGKMRRSGEAF
ncbi:hypothetical protein FIBSPDRAFT_865810, partial [Athelia psychrophila]